jgi:hypothetical protein
MLIEADGWYLVATVGRHRQHNHFVNGQDLCSARHHGAAATASPTGSSFSLPRTHSRDLADNRVTTLIMTKGRRMTEDTP